MRLLLTSDWHLGRQLHGHSLLEDQRHMLAQVVDHARRLRPDLVVIAGDLYDRAVPPPDAVALLDDTLQQLVATLGLQVVVIAGNHDSGERLGFAARLLAGTGLHIVGTLAQGLVPLPVKWSGGTAWCYPVPYAEPGEVRGALQGNEPLTHTAAMRAWLDPWRAHRGPAELGIVVAHAFVTGGTSCDSERPLSVGGSGAVDASAFDGFDFVALGHLHEAQTRGDGRLHYAGSPLKYSVSEAGHAKGIALVTLQPGQRPLIEALPLSPLHDLQVLTGSLEALCQSRPDLDLGTRVFARLTDPGALLDPMARLRATWPNALGLERLALGATGPGVLPQAAGAARQQALEPATLFDDFFRAVTGESLDPGQRAALLDCLSALPPEAGA